MSENTTANATNTETQAEESPKVDVKLQILTKEQEIEGLRVAHQFFSNFDRVPGFLANQWSQALDAVAVVANSLIAKANPSAAADASNAEEAASETTVTQ